VALFVIVSDSHMMTRLTFRSQTVRVASLGARSLVLGV
jgi:hypothetical protein